MGNQHKHEILSVAVKVAAFDESGIRRDFFNSTTAAAQSDYSQSLFINSEMVTKHKSPLLLLVMDKIRIHKWWLDKLKKKSIVGIIITVKVLQNLQNAIILYLQLLNLFSI